uniref:Uncharacterized protein n=1 Tax=Anguilla anguilla TaxID=7936 RepID=A0A0E9V6N7_ANGAN
MTFTVITIFLNPYITVILLTFFAPFHFFM